jgi:hypothetical protein
MFVAGRGDVWIGGNQTSVHLKGADTVETRLPVLYGDGHVHPTRVFAAGSTLWTVGEAGLILRRPL